MRGRLLDRLLDRLVFLASMLVTVTLIELAAALLR